MMEMLAGWLAGWLAGGWGAALSYSGSHGFFFVEFAAFSMMGLDSLFLSKRKILRSALHKQERWG